MYYINEGVYGSFNCLLFDHATVEAHLLDDHHDNKEKFPSSVWGPSCDSMDCVLKNVHLPKCNVGEWMYFKEMGAYTLSAASGFNGFLPPVCLYYISWGKRLDIDVYFFHLDYNFGSVKSVMSIVCYNGLTIELH